MTHNFLITIFGAAILALPIAANADTLASNAIVTNVFVGNSSSGQDQVWFKVQGQPSGVPVDCVAGGNALFYIANDGNIAQDHAEALLLTAKTTGLPVQIVYNVGTTASDLWIFGQTKCYVARFGVGG